jgi:capsule polysaccharide export protein KpsE/RkpR
MRVQTQEGVSVKQSGGVESPLHPLTEMEVPAPENGIGEGLSPVAPYDFEWAWLLWLNRRVLGRWTVRGLFLATIIAFLIPPQFESTTRLMPPDPNSGAGLGTMMMAAMAGVGGGGSAALGGSALGGLAGDLLGLHDAGAVFTDMLKSRTVQDRIIERFDLRKVYGTRYWASARKKLASRTTVSLDRKSGVITITVEDRDPQRVAKITQAYVEELDRIAAQVSTSAAHRERVFIEQRLTNVKQDLDKASREFSEYSSKNATLDIKEQGVAMVEAAAVLQGQLIAAQSELDGLQQIYTDSNVRIRSLRARVDELQRQLKKLAGDGDTPGSGGADSQMEFPSIRKLPLLGVRWADLYRENKIEETLYGLLTTQYELARIEEAKETPVVKVLDVAVVPEKKSGPPRTLIVVLGTIMAFAAGSVWVLTDAKWQRMDTGDSRKQLGQEIGARCVVLWSQIKIRWRALRGKIGKTGME